MTVASPVCPCGLTSRVSPHTDEFECRCGRRLAYEAACNAAPSPPPSDAWVQGEPWIDPPDGLYVSAGFSGLPRMWGYADLKIAPMTDDEIDRICAAEFERCHLRFMGLGKGRTMTAEDGTEIERHAAYAVAPVDRMADGVRHLVQYIARSGPGRVWSMMRSFSEPHRPTPVSYLRRWNITPPVLAAVEMSGVMHVCLASYYYHEPIKVNR